VVSPEAGVFVATPATLHPKREAVARITLKTAAPADTSNTTTLPSVTVELVAQCMWTAELSPLTHLKAILVKVRKINYFPTL
jgi:hypothetical protein